MAKLYIKNSSGNPGIGFPVFINGTPHTPSMRDGSIDIKMYIQKGIVSIIVNGAQKKFHRPLAIQLHTYLTFQFLMGNNPSCKFTENTENPIYSDSTHLPHFE